MNSESILRYLRDGRFYLVWEFRGIYDIQKWSLVNNFVNTVNINSLSSRTCLQSCQQDGPSWTYFIWVLLKKIINFCLGSEDPSVPHFLIFIFLLLMTGRRRAKSVLMWHGKNFTTSSNKRIKMIKCTTCPDVKVIPCHEVILCEHVLNFPWIKSLKQNC